MTNFENMNIDNIKQQLQQLIEQENAKLSDKLDRILLKNHHFSLLAEQFQQNLNQEIVQSQQLLNAMAARYSEDVEVALQTFINELDTEDEAMKTVLLQRETHRLEQAIYQKTTELELEITLLSQALATLIADMHRELTQAVEKPSRFAKVRSFFQQKCAPHLQKSWQRGRIKLGNALERFAVKLKAA